VRIPSITYIHQWISIANRIVAALALDIAPFITAVPGAEVLGKRTTYNLECSSLTLGLLGNEVFSTKTCAALGYYCDGSGNVRAGNLGEATCTAILCGPEKTGQGFRECIAS
jgi:hypothetical protein